MNSSRSSINYIYFGLFFLFLVLTAAGNIFAREDLTGSQFFFFLYAFGQAALEILFFIFAADLIHRFIGKKAFFCFIGFTFVLFILHSLDFMMSRILDLSIFGALKIFVLDETFVNFLCLLEASGIPNWAWAIFFALGVFVPMLGMLIYKGTEKLAERKALRIRNKYFLQAFICIPAALAFWDFSAARVMHPDAYTAFIKAIPWKCTFSYPANTMVATRGPIQQPKSEQAILTSIDQDQTTLTKRPNIYFFVIESLREDSITAQIAPNLHQFKQDYTHFDLALSNGNGSHLSWFSIFHSQFPYFWSSLQKDWKMGSPALHYLRKLGYKVRLYSSAELNYYKMEKFILGENLQLADNYQTFHHAPPVSAADTDSAAVAALNKDLREHPELQEGQVCIVFLDCTHFDYSWPEKNWDPKFADFATPTSYFQFFHSEKSIHLMKNRYHNAVHYMDHLFGSFFNSLPNKEEAIVMITGDHGEEFFEHGNLFHNSHLAQEQMHVPMYFKFGNQKKAVSPRGMISQMDIFPSLIDYLGGSPSAFLEGQSIFQKPSWPYVVTARFNASNTPKEFAIHNGTNKMIVQFANSNSFASRQLRVVSLRTKEDQCLIRCNELQPWIAQEFGPALERLFKKEP